MHFIGMSSIYIMTAFSIERILVILKQPNTNNVHKRIADKIIIICLLLGLIWSILPLIGWSFYTYEGLGVSCSII